MFYYTYITTLNDSDKYYVGRHQSNKHPNVDSYRGSGKWIKSIKDKSRLKRSILQFFSDEHSLILAEAELIKLHIYNINCMNMNENPIGFSSEYNPSKTAERKNIIRNRMSESNPMKGRKHKDSSKYLMRKYATNKCKSEDTRKKHRDSMIGKNLGKKWSDSQKEKRSLYMREQYASGERMPSRGFSGKQMPEKSKSVMREKALGRDRVVCEFCNIAITKQNYTRWHGDKCKHSPCHV